MVRKSSRSSSFHSPGRVAAAVVVLALLFYLNFFSRVLFSPLLPYIQKDVSLTNIESGSIFFCLSGGYCLALFLSGFVSSIINHANTIFLSCCTASLMPVHLSTAPSFPFFAGALVLLGLVAGLHLPSALGTVAGIVPQQYLARGMAIHELAPNLGFLSAPLIWQLFSSQLDWRTFLLLPAALLLVFGTAYRLSPFISREMGECPDRFLMRTLLMDVRFWQLVLLFSLAISSTLGIYAMLPLFLVAGHGIQQETANAIVGMSRIATLITPFFGGWLGDMVGNRRVMASVLIASGLFTVGIGLSSGAIRVVCVVIQALVAVCFFPSGLAVLLSFSVDSRKNVAIPFCIPMAFVIGGGIIPLVIGKIGVMLGIDAGSTAVGTVISLAGE